MGDARSITERGPQIFAIAGVLMLMLAAYLVGGDALTCERHGPSVDCEVARSRVFGRVVVERTTAKDIVDLRVRLTTSHSGEVLPPDAPFAGKTTTNDDLMVKTRAGQEVQLIGGDESGRIADDLKALLNKPAGAPVTFYDSFNIIAGAVGVFGLIFVAFGAIAMGRS